MSGEESNEATVLANSSQNSNTKENVPEIVTIRVEDEGKKSSSPSPAPNPPAPNPPNVSAVNTNQTTAAKRSVGGGGLSSQAQSRMSILSAACKKFEFVPFTKDGHTVFVKFSINLDETRSCNSGSVASFVIRLLTEGYWTLFVHGKKVQKNHSVYQKFSCENNLALSSKNYKLDIGKVDELFAYLNSCVFCVGNPEVYHLARESNVGNDGLTTIKLKGGTEAVEVMRDVSWEEKTYPSTMVHRHCELIRSLKEMSLPSGQREDQWFRCQPCEGILEELNSLNVECRFATSNAMAKFRTSRAMQTDVEPPSKRVCDSLSEMPLETYSRRIREVVVDTPSSSPQVAKISNSTLPLQLTIPSVAAAAAPPALPAPPAPPAPPVLPEPAPPQPVKLTANISNQTMYVLPNAADPTFLLAKTEEGKHYILKDTSGAFYCGMCHIPYKFPSQRQRVSFNEHLWMKHHVFINSISIWCSFCKKPFFDHGRFANHVKRDHPNMVVTSGS